MLPVNQLSLSLILALFVWQLLPRYLSMFNSQSLGTAVRPGATFALKSPATATAHDYSLHGRLRPAPQLI